MVEAAGQLFHLFRDRLDYAFILRIDCSMCGMRGVLFGLQITFTLILSLREGMKIIVFFPNPSAGSFAALRH